MKKSLIVPLILIGLGLVLGGAGTYVVHLATANEAPSTSHVSPSSAEHTESSATSSSSASDSAASDEKLIALLKSSTEQTNIFQSKFEVYNHISVLSERQVLEVLNRSLSLEDVTSRRLLGDVQLALVEKLVRINPVAAMAFAVEHQDLDFTLPSSELWGPLIYDSETEDLVFMPIVQTVFEEWALIDVEAAVDNAKSLHEDEKKNALTGILAAQTDESLATYQALARQLGEEDMGLDAYVASLENAEIVDPKATWTEVLSLFESKSLTPSDERGFSSGGGFSQSGVLGNIAQQWYELDGLQVLEEIGASSLDNDTKDNIRSTVLRVAAADDPVTAFEYAQSLPAQGGFSRWLGSVVQVWAGSDPQAAYHAVSNIKQSSQREGLQGQVVDIWASNEPYEVLDIVDSFPPQVKTSGVTAAIGAIAQSNPLEAAELALKQEGGMMGMLSMILPGQVMAYWVQQDAEAAENWIFNGPLNEKDRHAWVSALVINLVRSDPRHAFALGLKQPKGEGPMAAFLPTLEVQVLQQLVYSDLDLAIELLPQVRPGDSRAKAYSTVGDQYIDNGDFQSAMDLGSQLPTDEQTGFYRNIASSWALIDAGGLVESLKDFPNAEVRSIIAQELTVGWLKDNFNSAQIETLKQYISDSE